MKRRRLIGMALVLGILPTLASAAPIVSLGSYTVKPGDTFTVNLSFDADANTPVFAFETKVWIKPDFSLPSGTATAGSALPSLWSTTPANTSAAFMFLSTYYTGSNAADFLKTGVLYSFPVTVAANTGAGTYPLELKNFSIGDFDGNQYADNAAQWLDGLVTVRNTNPPIAPIPGAAILLGSGVLGLLGLRRKVSA